MREARPKTAGVNRVVALATAALTATALSVLTASPAFAATSTVCAAGCDHTTIQAAVTAAADGDTINIGAGTYNESVTIDKSLTLTGPNANISPNTSDPLVANAARGPEAIITPPSGDDIHAINLTNTAVNVTISGITIDRTGTVYTATGQRFISALAAAGNGSLTLTNNIFTEGAGTLVGSTVYETSTGDSTITVTNNRFTNAAISNGMYLNNSSPNSTMTLGITNNVWLDNGYLAGNFSTDSGTVIVGNLSNNWIGNSTPGTSGVDQYDTRQAGFLLAGTYAGFNLTDNIFKDIEDSALLFWNGFDGTISITDNEIDGYSNVGGYAAIRVSTGAPTSDVTGIDFTGNSITNPTAGSLAIVNDGAAGIFDATGNWWGSATPNFDALVSIPNVGHPVGYTVLVDGWLTSFGQTGSGNPSLAETGVNTGMEVPIVGFLLLLLGGAVVFMTRRRLQRD